MQKHVAHSFNQTACRQISDGSRDSVRARPAAHPRTFGLPRHSNAKHCQTLDKRALNGCPFLILQSLFPVTDCAQEEKSIWGREGAREIVRTHGNASAVYHPVSSLTWNRFGHVERQTMRCEDSCFVLVTTTMGELHQSHTTCWWLKKKKNQSAFYMSLIPCPN